MDVRKEVSPVRGFTGGSFAEVLTFRQATFPYDVSFRHKSRNAPDPWRLIISHRLLDMPDSLATHSLHFPIDTGLPLA